MNDATRLELRRKILVLIQEADALTSGAKITNADTMEEARQKYADTLAVDRLIEACELLKK